MVTGILERQLLAVNLIISARFLTSRDYKRLQTNTDSITKVIRVVVNSYDLKNLEDKLWEAANQLPGSLPCQQCIH